MKITESPRSDGQVDEEGNRRYAREFTVNYEGQIVDAATVLLTVGVPKWGDYYLPTDLSARCRGVVPRREPDRPDVWRVRSEYTTKLNVPTPPPNENHPNPLLRPAKIRWSSVRATRTQAKDADGKPFQNTYKEPFQSPPPVVRTQNRLVITRNEPSFNPILPFTYGNTTNSDTWYGFDAGKVLCEEISAENAWDYDIAYAVVTYSFLFDRKGFEVEVLNTGTHYKDAKGKKQHCHVGNVWTSVPQKLAADSTLLPENGTPHYLTFAVYDSEDFGALNI